MFLQDKALVHNSGETEGHGGTGGSSILAVIQIETNVIQIETMEHLYTRDIV